MPMRRSSMPAGAGRRSGSRRCAVNSYCSAWVRGARTAPASGAERMPALVRGVAALDRADLLDLRDQLGERREIAVAFEQRRPHAEFRIGEIEQLPYRIDHGRGVAVDDQVGGFVVVPGDVEIGDALARQRADELHRVVAVVDAVDVDVVDVEQQIAVGFGEHRAGELDLAHFPARRGIVRRILDRHAPAEDVLGAADARGDPVHGFLGERDRHQIVQVAVVGTEREVFAVETDAVVVEETTDLVQQGLVERRRTAERQRQTVAYERVAFGEGSERAAELAADVDPVLGRDLEEVDRRVRGVLQRAQQGPPQTESRTVYRLAWTPAHLSDRCKNLPCPSCRPSRSLPCPSCPPSRNLPCPSCRPSRSLPCPSCRPNTNLPCPSCRPTTTSPCPSCRPSRSLPCPSCRPNTNLPCPSSCPPNTSLPCPCARRPCTCPARPCPSCPCT